MKQDTAVKLGNKIRKKEIAVSEALDFTFEKIKEKEENYRCFISLDKDRAYKKAKEIQSLIDAGILTHPLAGVPIAVKDNLCTKGIPTTCGSKMLENFVPGYSATAIKRLENAGMIIIGKTNMDEFGMGSTTETSYFGATKNPKGITHVPGGSSGGSAAAVAAGECFGALGTDTGGSVRQPAAYCGVVGMKPTYGMVSRYGLISYASSFDQIGPIGKDVTDVAVLLETIAGRDEKDSTSVGALDVGVTKGLIKDVAGVRVGIIKEFMDEGLEEEIRSRVNFAAELLRKNGAIVEKVDFPMLKYAVPVYYTIADAEASSNLERYDGVKFGYRAEGFHDLTKLYEMSRGQGFGEEVKRRIMLGTYVLSSGYYDAYYLKAQKGRRKIKEAFDALFARYDVILGPVAPTVAPKLGASLKDPLKMYLGDVYTILANLAGLPAISLPFGENKEGLPIGVQLMADCFRDASLIQIAYSLEKFREEQC